MARHTLSTEGQKARGLIDDLAVPTTLGVDVRMQLARAFDEVPAGDIRIILEQMTDEAKAAKQYSDLLAARLVVARAQGYIATGLDG